MSSLCCFSLLWKSFSVWCSSQKTIPQTNVVELLFCVFLIVYNFRYYHYVSNAIFVYFCICYEIRIQFHISACGYELFPKEFIEETVISPLYVYGTFLKNQLTKILWGLFLGSILFHCLIGLFLCQYHEGLITIAL